MGKKKSVSSNSQPRKVDLNNHIDKDLFGLNGSSGDMKLKEQFEIFKLMYSLTEKGVSPEEYELFFNIYNTIANNLEKEEDSQDFFHEVSEFDSLLKDLNFGMKKMKAIKEYKPLKEAKNHTLVLKISMKDVKKPPMWREITIPADFTFNDLHWAIQDITGLENCHLWQFNKSAYDHGLTIGIEAKSDYDFGIQEATHDASKTGLTRFLQEKGDKLEYVYDFGDDWIFTVEVKDLLKEKTEYPVCTKFKCNFNPAEDIGGVWTYLDYRDIFDKWESLSSKERNELVKENGYYDTPEDFYEFLRGCLFNLDETNDVLKNLSR